MPHTCFPWLKCNWVKSSAEDVDHGWPSRNSIMLHVVFNKESSNSVTGVKVIEHCQTSKGREEHEQQQKTNTDGHAKLKLNLVPDTLT